AILMGNALLRLAWLPRPVQQRPWWNWVLNAAQVSLSIGVASGSYQLLVGSSATIAPASAGALGAFIVAAGLARVINAGGVALAVRCYQGTGDPWHAGWASIRSTWREELGLALTAVATAVVAVEYPWVVLAQAGSIAVVYLSFRQN